MELLDYKNLSFSVRRELDQEAYEQYYQEQDFESNQLYTFNTFYGSDLHKKYLKKILRKLKLDEINKK